MPLVYADVPKFKIPWSPRSFPLGNSSDGDLPFSAQTYSPVVFGCCLLHGGMAMANEIFAELLQTFSFLW